MTEYITSQGDMLDWICWRFYGRSDNGTVEILLAENARTVADHGPVFPAGVLLRLPPIQREARAVDPIRLWD